MDGNESQRPTKRLKTGDSEAMEMVQEAVGAESTTFLVPRDASPSQPTPEDVMGIVMEYLAPRELLNLAFCSKAMSKLVTTRMVVRSALLQSGHARNTIMAISQMTQGKAIFPPSSLRLLRLVNGKRCEFCSKKTVRTIRADGNGFFYCRSCQERYMNELKLPSTTRAKEIIRSPRLRPSGPYHGVYRVPGYRLVLGGENVGPILAFVDVQNLLYNDKYNHLSVDDYIEAKQRSPKRDRSELIEAYEESKERGSTEEAARKQKRQETHNRTLERRKAQVMFWLRQLRERINEPYRDIALKLKDVSDQPEWTKRSLPPVIVFDCPIVHDLLVEYIIYPGKMNGDILQDKGAEINSCFRKLENFLKFTFLSDNEEFDSKLKTLCIELFPDVKTVLSCTDGSRDRLRFQKMIQEERYTEAITLFFKNNFGFLAVHDTPLSLAMEAHFLTAWERKNACEEQDKDTDAFKMLLLAHDEWELHVNTRDEWKTDQNGKEAGLEHLRIAYTACKESLGDLKAAADEYISSVESCFHKFRGVLSYASVVKRVETLLYTETYVRFLHERDFVGLFVEMINGTELDNDIARGITALRKKDRDRFRRFLVAIFEYSLLQREFEAIVQEMDNIDRRIELLDEKAQGIETRRLTLDEVNDIKEQLDDIRRLRSGWRQRLEDAKRRRIDIAKRIDEALVYFRSIL